MKRSSLPAGLALASALTRAVYSHEPIHGLAPDTPARGLFAYEVEWEWEGEGESIIAQELLYGVTPDFALTVRVPYARADEGSRSGGLRDLWLRAKWRFVRRDFPGGSDQVAAVVGLRVPTDRGAPWGGLIALTATHSFGHWYLWGDALTEMATRHVSYGGRPRFAADVALGWRPYLAEYDQVDINPVVELNTLYENATATARETHLFLSPGVLVSYKRYLLKSGVQIPINTDERHRPFGVVAALEIHF